MTDPQRKWGLFFAGLVSAVIFSTATHSAVRTEEVSFYLLRLEFTTSSDRAAVDLKAPEAVLSSRLVEISGEPKRYSARNDRITLGQSPDQAQRGETVGITLDLAIDPQKIHQPLRFALRKTRLNVSRLRVYWIDGDRRQLLKEAEQAEVSDPRRDILRVEVNLAPLAAAAPQRKTIELPVYEKKLLAFYYPWYKMRSWDAPRLKDHPLVRYESDDPETIKRQIEQAKSVGIDGFVSSWWGPNTRTDKNLKPLLDIAAEKDFEICIYFETLTGAGDPIEPEEAYRRLEFMLSTYADHPAYIKMDGKPVVLFWAAEEYHVDKWGEIFARLREKGLDGFFIFSQYDEMSLRVFDGFTTYGVFGYSNIKRVFKEARRKVDLYPLLNEKIDKKMWIATVQPGYDERKLPNRRGLFRDREGGNFYRRTWEAALQTHPDWIVISTWNEWWENSYIEPSEKYGDKYLQITREYALKWKGESFGTGGDPVERNQPPDFKEKGQ
jgi:hypothetical protein